MFNRFQSQIVVPAPRMPKPAPVKVAVKERMALTNANNVTRIARDIVAPKKNTESPDELMPLPGVSTIHIVSPLGNEESNGSSGCSMAISWWAANGLLRK